MKFDKSSLWRRRKSRVIVRHTSGIRRVYRRRTHTPVPQSEPAQVAQPCLSPLEGAISASNNHLAGSISLPPSLLVHTFSHLFPSPPPPPHLVPLSRGAAGDPHQAPHRCTLSARAPRSTRWNSYRWPAVDCASFYRYPKCRYSILRCLTTNRGDSAQCYCDCVYFVLILLTSTGRFSEAFAEN